MIWKTYFKIRLKVLWLLKSRMPTEKCHIVVTEHTQVPYNSLRQHQYGSNSFKMHEFKSMKRPAAFNLLLQEESHFNQTGLSTWTILRASVICVISL